jgi:hypothetical protein
VSLPVSGRLSIGDTIVFDGLRIGAARRALPALSLAVEQTVTFALLPCGDTSNAMKGSLIDAGHSTAWSKDGGARCPSGFDSARSRYVCHAWGGTAMRHAVRQATAGGLGDEPGSITNATRCVRLCDPDAASVRDHTRWLINTCRVPIATGDPADECRSTTTY